MTEKVTIIGAGIVGICSALSLLEKGYAVRVLDRDPPASGASSGNAGVVSPWSCVPQSLPGLWKSVPKWVMDPEGPIALRPGYLPKFIPWAWKFLKAGDERGLGAIGDAMNALNRPNVDLYRHHLNGTGGEALLQDSLYVHVYKRAEDADLNALGWRMRAERDVPMEVVTRGAVREVEPDLSEAYQGAVLIKDQARAMDPGAVGRTLAEKATRLGATFVQTAVREIKPLEGGGFNIVTDEGGEAASRVVLAAGAWSARLLKPLGIDLPLEAERGYHLVLKEPGVRVNNSIMDTEGKFVASQMNAGVRCAGTAEFAGLDTPPDMRRARVFKTLAQRLFPKINTDDAIEWMGTRPSFPDSLPALGPVPGHPGLYAAFGHSHYGFGMGPQTGRVVAHLVEGSSPNIDMTPYRLDRF